jgi:hypothetical protein
VTEVFTLGEIFDCIDRYGWPQVWNREGRFGPEWYIEAQIWDHAPLRSYIDNWKNSV